MPPHVVVILCLLCILFILIDIRLKMVDLASYRRINSAFDLFESSRSLLRQALDKHISKVMNHQCLVRPMIGACIQMHGPGISGQHTPRDIKNYNL